MADLVFTFAPSVTGRRSIVLNAWVDGKHMGGISFQSRHADAVMQAVADNGAMRAIREHCIALVPHEERDGWHASYIPPEGVSLERPAVGIGRKHADPADVVLELVLKLRAAHA